VVVHVRRSRPRWAQVVVRYAERVARLGVWGMGWDGTWRVGA